MRGGRDLDPGQLLRRRAVFIHVPAGDVRVGGHDGARHRDLERIVRDVRCPGPRHSAGRHPFGARPAGERDQRDVAAAFLDGLRGVADMHDVGAAAHVGGIDVAELGQAHVVGLVDRPEARGGTGAEEAVDVVLGQAGILQGAEGDFGMELGDRLALGLARRVLEGPDDIGCAVDAHGGGGSSCWFQSGRREAAEWPPVEGGARPFGRLIGRSSGRTDRGHAAIRERTARPRPDRPLPPAHQRMARRQAGRMASARRLRASKKVPAGSVRDCTGPGGASLPGWGAIQRGRNSAKYS
jgi:hypothetical protein